MTTTRQALIEKCDREGREARAAGRGRSDCPYGDRQTIARDAWLEGYRRQKQLQFNTTYSAQGGQQPMTHTKEEWAMAEGISAAMLGAAKTDCPYTHLQPGLRDLWLKAFDTANADEGMPEVQEALK